MISVRTIIEPYVGHFCVIMAYIIWWIYLVIIPKTYNLSFTIEFELIYLTLVHFLRTMFTIEFVENQHGLVWIICTVNNSSVHSMLLCHIKRLVLELCCIRLIHIYDLTFMNQSTSLWVSKNQHGWLNYLI